MSEDRITVRIVTKSKPRWGVGLLLLLVGGYPDAEDEVILVEVTDAVRGRRWSIPVRTMEHARRVRDRVRATVRTMSGAEIEEWSAVGRWTTLKD